MADVDAYLSATLGDAPKPGSLSDSWQQYLAGAHRAASPALPPRARVAHLLAASRCPTHPTLPDLFNWALDREGSSDAITRAQAARCMRGGRGRRWEVLYEELTALGALAGAPEAAAPGSALAAHSLEKDGRPRC